MTDVKARLRGLAESSCISNDIIALLDHCERVECEAAHYKQQLQKSAEILSRIEKTTQLLEKRVEELFVMTKQQVPPEEIQ